MLCRFTLKEPERIRGNSSTSTLLVGGNDKIDLWQAKTEVFEIIQPMSGNMTAAYKMRCLHINQGIEDIMGEAAIPMTLLIPHYEVGFFKDRVFRIEFDKSKYLQLTGGELSSLAC
jgi:hypothetical protein